MYKAPLNERGFSILVMGIMRIEVWRMKKARKHIGFGPIRFLYLQGIRFNC